MPTTDKTEPIKLPPPPPIIRLSREAGAEDTNEKPDVKIEQIICNYDNDIFCPPPPASSVFELPVPAKPPPEVVDLLDDDVIEEDPVEQTAAELITLHTKYYPGNPLPKLGEVERICDSLIAEYEVKGVQAPRRRGLPQRKTMVTNYLRHMVQNQKVMNRCLHKLTEDSESNAITEAVWKTWSARTNINDHMDEVLRHKQSGEGEVKSTITNPKKNWKEVLPFLIDGRTQLQSILVPKFSQPLPTAAIMNTDLIWKAQWSPLNLTLSYELFKKSVPTTHLFSSVGATQGRRLMKKWYIEYMNNVATSEQEFLMAVISCIGTNVTFYPGRVLSIFRSKNMLVESFQNVQVDEVDLEVTVFSVNQQNSNTMVTNDESQSQNRQGTRNVLAQLISTPERSQVTNTNKNVQSPSQPQNQTLPPEGQLIPNAEREKMEFLFGVSCEQLGEILQRIYCDFTGTTAVGGQYVLNEWWQGSGCTLTSRNVGWMKRTFKILENENNHFNSRKGAQQIKKLNITEIDQWRNFLNSEKMARKEEAIKKNPTLQSTPFTPQLTMECGMSFLQLSLVEGGSTVPAQEIPPRNGWSPVNCALPYELFKTLFIFNTKRKLELERIQFCFLPEREVLNVYEDAVKVRYVEFMWNLFNKNMNQFLIGVLSAIGPDPDDLPLRILHILQLTGLWRSDLGLPLCYSINDPKQVYKPLSENFRKRRAGDQIPATFIPAKVAKPNPPPAKVRKPNSSPAEPTNPNPPMKNLNLEQIDGTLSPAGRFVWQSVWGDEEPPHPPPSPSQPPRLFPARSSAFTLDEWIRVTRTALEEFELPELSGSGCLETYQRYKDYCQTPHGNEDVAFLKGMLAGISVARKSNGQRIAGNEKGVVNNSRTTTHPAQPDQLTHTD